MKDRISKEYGHVTSVKIIKDLVANNFGDYSWNYFIESMSDRIRAVIKAKGGSTSY